MYRDVLGEGDAFSAAVIDAAKETAEQLSRKYGLEHADVWSVAVCMAYDPTRKRWLEVAVENGDTGMLGAAIYRATEKHYDKIRQKCQKEGSAYWYEPRYVRLFLPYFFSFQDWESAETSFDAEGDWKAGEAIDTALDMRRGWWYLREPQRNAIMATHLWTRPLEGGGRDWDRVAELIGATNGDAARDQYNRATHRLAYEMNGKRVMRIMESSDLGAEKIGARRVISNAQARAAINNNLQSGSSGFTGEGQYW